MGKPGSGLQVLAWVSVGILLGLAAYTFRYAEGPSYFSDDPKVCLNCHVMRDNHHSWQGGPHHAVAACNDCHVPHSFPAKWLAKAEHGWNHSVKFTLQNYETPIRIRPANLDRLQANCIRCHGEQIDRMEGHPVKAEEVRGGGIRCTDCHSGVGHLAN